MGIGYQHGYLVCMQTPTVVRVQLNERLENYESDKGSHSKTVTLDEEEVAYCIVWSVMYAMS